jgi:hypothetical protein
MKKGLLALLIVLFATAAYAEVKFDISGDFHARGNYFDNANITGVNNYLTSGTTTNVRNSFYDSDINLYPKLTVDKATLNFKLSIRDQVWGEDILRSSSPSDDADSPLGAQTSNLYTSRKDDNISVERAWMTYRFTDNSVLDVGLMDGQVWGSTFADRLEPRWRVKFTQKTPVGAFGAVLEKNAEVGHFLNVRDAEKDDYDSYGIFAVTKAGNIWIKPLLFYVVRSSVNENLDLTTATTNDLGNAGVKVWYPALELNGDLGPISFDSEFGYKRFEFNHVQGVEPYEKDASVWGAYINLFKALDWAKPGIIAAYGSWDKGTGLFGSGYGWDFRQDFKSNLILGGAGVDAENVSSIPLGATRGLIPIKKVSAALAAAVPGTFVSSGPTLATAATSQVSEDLTGFTLIKPYIADVKTPIKDLTCSASFGYMISNQDNTIWEDTKAWEADLGVAYKLSNNVVYSIEAGYAKIKDVKQFTVAVPANTLAPGQPDLYRLTDLSNPDPIMVIQHKIEFTF